MGLTHTSLLQSLMAALVVLEGMVRPEFLKQQWRPFAMPAPQPADISERPRLPACLMLLRLQQHRALGGTGLQPGCPACLCCYTRAESSAACPPAACLPTYLQTPWLLCGCGLRRSRAP